jgi:hypothetical protein
MGDRSNIAIEQHDGSRVWLYGHYMGENSINVVREVLALRERWDDAPYLTRMLFNKMTEDESSESTTGFGISTYLTDNEYPVIVLNPQTKLVHIEDVGEKTVRIMTPLTPFSSFLVCGSEHGPRFANVISDMKAIALMFS